MGSLPRKQTVVQQIQKDIEGASVAYVLDYRGLSVAEISNLRRELAKSNARLTVVKNTLMKRAVDGTDMSVINDLLKGPTALAYTSGDQVAPIKVIKEYLKKAKKENEIRGAYLDGKMLGMAEVDQLAKLPPLEELRAKLLGGIASPLTGIVAAISGPQRGLVTVLGQYAKLKEQQQ